MNHKPAETIRFYVCSNCAITKHRVATNPDLRESKAAHVRPWHCSVCGRTVHSLEEHCYTIPADEGSKRDYDRDPGFASDVWFVRRNFGYFDSSITIIADIET